ncbi:MAG: hypothetical protein J6A35_02575 [Paludibacteraceae bacterium]|nr:hypothetical protein [Paludibacteraceae bacterium]
MAIILLALPSCKSLDTTTLHHDTQHYTTLHNAVDTLIIHDSIFVREYVAGDTVFRDRIQYRDRWRTHIVHDTIIKIDSIVQVIDHPPRKYIPSFHKWSTAAFWILIALSILYLILRTKIYASNR